MIKVNGKNSYLEIDLPSNVEIHHTSQKSKIEGKFTPKEEFYLVNTIDFLPNFIESAQNYNILSTTKYRSYSKLY